MPISVDVSTTNLTVFKVLFFAWLFSLFPGCSGCPTGYSDRCLPGCSPGYSPGCPPGCSPGRPPLPRVFACLFDCPARCTFPLLSPPLKRSSSWLTKYRNGIVRFNGGSASAISSALLPWISFSTSWEPLYHTDISPNMISYLSGAAPFWTIKNETKSAAAPSNALFTCL